MPILSLNGQWRLESTGTARRLYLSDQGWSVVETQGADWGEVIVLSPQGSTTVRVGVTDCGDRPT